MGYLRAKSVRQGLLLLSVTWLSACAWQPPVEPAPWPRQPPTSDPGRMPVPEAVRSAPQPLPAPSQRQAPARMPLSNAAQSLLASAEQHLDAGDNAAAIVTLERAQRIAPNAPQVYYQLSLAYLAQQDYLRAEQFALKGVAKSGQDAALSAMGWRQVAAIRRARGDQAGAESAMEKAKYQ